MLIFRTIDLSLHSQVALRFRDEAIRDGGGTLEKDRTDRGYLAWLRQRIAAEPRFAVHAWKDDAIVGEVLHRFSLSEFCRALGTLITGGMPLVPALEIATGAVANASIRAALAPRIQMVREGKPFHAMLDASEVFPAMAIDMVKVGEATGSLDEMLGNVSDLFDEQAETRLQRLLTLVEPVMLVFMGLIIGLLLVSIYLPLFRALGTVS